METTAKPKKTENREPPSLCLTLARVQNPDFPSPCIWDSEAMSAKLQVPSGIWILNDMGSSTVFDCTRSIHDITIQQ